MKIHIELSARFVFSPIAWSNEQMLSGKINSTLPHIALDLILSGGAGRVSPAEIAANFQDLNSTAYLYSSPGYIRGVIKTDKKTLKN